jgi:hypothetical protein
MLRCERKELHEAHEECPGRKRRAKEVAPVSFLEQIKSDRAELDKLISLLERYEARARQ